MTVPLLHARWTSIAWVLEYFHDGGKRFLSADEIAHAAKFPAGQSRLFYIARRAWLRRQLSGWLDRSPEDIRFGLNPYGKPHVEGEHLAFNLSTSRGMILLAAGPVTSIGCDIEHYNPDFRFEPIVTLFSKDEQNAFRNLAKTQARAAFYHTWTCKEAYVKAVGSGLSCGLDTFSVDINPRNPARLLSGCEGFSIQSFTPEPDFRAAVVATGEWHLCVGDLDRSDELGKALPARYAIDKRIGTCG